MKKVSVYIMAFLLPFLAFCPHLDAEELVSKAHAASKRISIKQLQTDFKHQWSEVQKRYPAVAIAFMFQEAALLAVVHQQPESAEVMIGRYVSISGTPILSSAATNLRVKDCLNKLVFCTERASSSGGISVDEVRGCRNAFSNCWTRNSD